MAIGISLSLLAVLISGLAAIYARWSAQEAKKANDMLRLNGLLSLRVHYLELMRHQEHLAKLLGTSTNGLQSVQNTYADLDLKLRQVNSEIDKYHSSFLKITLT